MFHDKVLKTLARSREPPSPQTHSLSENGSLAEPDSLSGFTTHEEVEHLVAKLLARCACAEYQNMLDKDKHWS